MPNYALQCNENPDHKDKIRMTYAQFDRMKGKIQCLRRESHDYGAPWPLMHVVTQAVPFKMKTGGTRNASL